VLFLACIVVIDDGWLLAINDEHIKFAVTSGNRPPLDAIAGPAHDLMSSLKKLIARCWHKSPDKRPSFVG